MKTYKIVVSRKVQEKGKLLFVKLDIEKIGLTLEEARVAVEYEIACATQGQYGEKSTITKDDLKTVCSYDGGWAIFNTEIEIQPEIR